MFINPEMSRINRLIIEGGQNRLTENRFFAAEINEWLTSEKRKCQLTGSDYYAGKQDIQNRRRTMIGENGELQEVENLPNNRVVDNQFALMVDQKTNYLLGKPFTVNCQNKEYADLLNGIFDRRFQRMMKYVCEDALCGGIAWVFPYYDGGLRFRHFPAEDILPFWADDDHTILDCAIRFYAVEVYDGCQKKLVDHAELFRRDGLWRYIYDNGTLIPDVESGEHEDYLTDGENGFNWQRIPLIPFKYNKQEIPLICRCRTLQDGINLMLSDYMNGMQEDTRNTILVLKNYDGENLGEFRKNLSTFGAVKVRDDGGIETLSVEVNSENYKSILELMKKSLIENARGYDAKGDKLAGNPNQMNIQSMYSDIDLDANGMETEFQASFEELLWFINAHLINSGKGSFDDPVSIVFNRDMLINETESIENCQKSIGILSNETIIEQHPWVTDVETELSRLKRENAQAGEYSDDFTSHAER